ncbi:MAG: ATP-binding cassette domain-containing protein [Rhodospirillaceae bacterium]
MNELIARFRKAPVSTAYLLIASLLINMLGFSSSLYVIQVLNRYVSYGVTATLVTMTSGVVIAIGAEYLFRRLRLRLAEEIVGDADSRLATGVFGLLLTTPLTTLEPYSPAERIELVRGIERTEAALGPPALAALADVPFSLLFLGALALLSPPLAMIATVFCLGSLFLALETRRRLAEPTRSLSILAERIGSLVNIGTAGAETVRQFNGATLLMTRWAATATEARTLRNRLNFAHADSASIGQALQAFMGAAVICAGAVLVVSGQLDVGALIGANLIAARALAPLARLVQMGGALKSAELALAAARRFAQTAGTVEGYKTLPGWKGGLELRGVGFQHSGTSEPLYKALDISLVAGDVLLVTGRNGTGKSSFLRLIAGLIEPSHGRILVDGVDLRQISLEWWRQNVSYLPQEPVFLDDTIRENLLAARPDADVSELERCLAIAGLLPFINHHPAGLDQVLTAEGRTLAPGLRRRLALARAILVDGPLFLLDEPSEGLDRQGAEAVYALLIDLVRRNKTLVVVSHDPAILRGARRVLRFDGGEPVSMNATELAS